MQRLHAFWKGLCVTFAQLFKRPVTCQYPNAMRPIPDRLRGLLTVLRHANGRSRCVGCQSCEKLCPANAIQIDRHDGKRVAHVWVDYGRCLLCGQCVAGCPYGALAHTQTWMASYKTADALRVDLLATGKDAA